MKSTGQKQEETPSKGRTEEDVRKLAHRIILLLRDLEVHSLDIALYSKPLAAGKFPINYILQEEKAMTSAITELSRIQKAWCDLFKEEMNNGNKPK